LLRVTPQGQQLLADVNDAVLKTQERILRPLPVLQRQEFLRMLKVLVDANNEASRAPRSLD
jgi:DNA-binding MarR family transcriptional regulator